MQKNDLLANVFPQLVLGHNPFSALICKCETLCVNKIAFKLGCYQKITETNTQLACDQDQFWDMISAHELNYFVFCETNIEI